MSEVNDFVFMLFHSCMNDYGMEPLMFINYDFIGFVLKIEFIEDINLNLAKM